MKNAKTMLLAAAALMLVCAVVAAFIASPLVAALLGVTALCLGGAALNYSAADKKSDEENSK